MSSLFSDFLDALGVKHNADYSDKRFAEMPFPSMFGLANLLGEYGVATIGVSIPPDKLTEALRTLPTPFLADTPSGFAIVKRVCDQGVCYVTQTQEFTAPVSELAMGWNGIALLAQADENSCEPSYARHRVGEASKTIKRWLLAVLAIALIGVGMWQSGHYAQWAAWFVLAFDCGGLWFSWQLVEKSLGIKSKAGEAVCSALEEGGCDEIARSEASSFMGIFKWSEVGLAYFSVSLLTLFLVPQAMAALAAINILCLPYTVWSIWYQRFKAKTWCTLCVCVQCTLWLLFFSYLLGGWTCTILPLTGEFALRFIILGACYVAVMLGINRLDDALLKIIKIGDDDTSEDS